MEKGTITIRVTTTKLGPRESTIGIEAYEDLHEKKMEEKK